MTDRPGGMIRDTVRLRPEQFIGHIGDLFTKVVERVGKALKYRLHRPPKFTREITAN